MPQTSGVYNMNCKFWTSLFTNSWIVVLLSGTEGFVGKLRGQVTRRLVGRGVNTPRQTCTLIILWCLICSL